MLNSIVLVGRLTKDPEVVSTQQGGQVTTFSLAFKQGVNADGSEDTGFVNCKAFSTLSSICAEWLSKGDKIAVEGRIQLRKFVRKDGSNGLDPTILVNNLEFIDVLKSGNTEEQENQEAQEIPFDPAPEVKVKEIAKPVAKPTRNRR